MSRHFYELTGTKIVSHRKPSYCSKINVKGKVVEASSFDFRDKFVYTFLSCLIYLLN